MWFSRVRSFAFDTYRRLETRQHQLLYLFLEITRHCNLSCLHCGSDCVRTGDSIKELTTANWLLLIDDIRRSFGPDVMLVLTGGEPLLHPDLEEITGHIASHAMRWGLVTNGHGLTGARLASFIDHGIGSITISLDGPEAAHDSLRNLPGAYSKTTDAMCRIGAAAIPMRDVVTCIHPGNLDRLDETAEIILASAIPAWRLFRIFPSGRAATRPDLHLDFAQTRRMLDWIAANRPRLAQRGLRVQASCEGYLPFELDRRVRDVPFFCRAGVNFGAIRCDGTVTGCTNNDPTFDQGNVLENNFRWIWENRFDVFRERSWLAGTQCATCPEAGCCRGGSIHLWRLGETAPRFCYCYPAERDA
jgi:radical SAM protein with 4Fe4S-binding SPASM domain